MKSAVEIAKEVVEEIEAKNFNGIREGWNFGLLAQAVIDAEKIIRMAPSQTESRSLGWARDCDKWLSKHADDKKEEEK